MKKAMLFITAAVCVVMLPACAGSNNTNGSQNNTSATGATSTSNQTQADSQSTGDSQSDAAVVSADQPGETPADSVKVIYGEISEVIGNALVIKEIEQPSFNLDGGGPQMRFELEEGATEFTMPDGTVVPIGEDGRPDFSGIEMPEGFQRFNTSGEDGEMTMTQGGVDGQGGGPTMIMGEGAATFDRGAAREGMQTRSMERAYTGEEIEVIVPVGVPIMTRSRGESGMEEKEVAISTLKAGNIITITYKEDGKTIDTVFVSQSGGGGMMGGGGGDMFFQGGDMGGAFVVPAMPAR